MQLGDVVDYCIAYNERQEAAEESANVENAPNKPEQPQKVKVRYATQDEISAYWS